MRWSQSFVRISAFAYDRLALPSTPLSSRLMEQFAGRLGKARNAKLFK